MEKKCLEVCAAVAFCGGRLLNATRRPGGSLAGMWEFPGGKCIEGESLSACITRELEEELGLEVTGALEILMLSYDYPDKKVNLHFMQCELRNPDCAVPREGQEVGWHLPSELGRLSFAPADSMFLEVAASGGASLKDGCIVNAELLQSLTSWFRARCGEN